MRRAIPNIVFTIAVTLPGFVAAQAAQSGDPSALAQSDSLMLHYGRGIGGAVLDNIGQAPKWAGGFLTGGATAPSDAQVAHLTGKGLAIGYTTGWLGLSPFIAYGQGESLLDDDTHSARIRGYSIGLAMTGQTERFTYGIAAFASRTHNKISSPDSASGAADFDGQLLGLTLRGNTALLANATGGTALDLSAQGDVLRHRTDKAALTGGNGQLGERVSVAHSLRIELGAPMERAGLRLRPYLAYTAQGGMPDALDFGATRRDAPNLIDDDIVSLGMTFGSDRPDHLTGRVEVSESQHDTAWQISVGYSF